MAFQTVAIGVNPAMSSSVLGDGVALPAELFDRLEQEPGIG